MKPAGLLLPPTLYPERRRPGEPRASPAPFGPDPQQGCAAGCHSKLGEQVGQTEGQERPSGESWMPPKCCIPPVPLVLAGFALKQTPKIHCISPCRCPWGEQLPRSGVFFVSPLKYICIFISEGKNAFSYIHITTGIVGS